MGLGPIVGVVMQPSSRGIRSRADLVVVGAGIVGLAAALAAVERGARVVVVERDDRAVGASIRNFGHVCATAQEGQALDLAMISRRRWLSLASCAGFWLAESGTVVVARAEDEMAVLDELSAARSDDLVLLDRTGVTARSNIDGADVVDGAWFPLDVRVDARRAMPAIADALVRLGVEFRWQTNVLGVAPGCVRTNHGDIAADHIVVAVGHDLDRLLPDVASSAGIERCVLQMLAVDPPAGARFPAAVLTGTSMLRYGAFRDCPSIGAVRRRLESSSPELFDHDVNLMFTQRPNGDLVIGDTHASAATHEPFRPESAARLLLEQFVRLLGASRLTVRERWTGMYATAPHPFLVDASTPGITSIAVTSGIGMTTAFGLAERVVDGLGGAVWGRAAARRWPAMLG